MYQKGISNKYTQIKLVLVSLKDMIVSSKNIDKCEHKCIYSNRVINTLSFFCFSFSYFPLLLLPFVFLATMTTSHKQQQQQQQHTFQAIIVHAENEDCSRDILVSPTITLNQLNRHLLNAFDMHERFVDYYQFFQNDDKLEIETCFGLIGDQQQELDGFLIPIAPGVYIGNIRN